MVYVSLKNGRGGRKTYPSAGPRNGASRKKMLAIARLCGGNKSAFVPPPTARTGPPVNPASIRHAQKVPKLLARPEPRINSADTGREIRYMIRRPYVSLIGAAMTGPNPSPST